MQTQDTRYYDAQQGGDCRVAAGFNSCVFLATVLGIGGAVYYALSRR